MTLLFLLLFLFYAQRILSRACCERNDDMTTALNPCNVLARFALLCPMKLLTTHIVFMSPNIMISFSSIPSTNNTLGKGNICVFFLIALFNK